MVDAHIYPVLAASSQVSSIPKYTEDMRKALNIARPVMAYNTATIVLGTATSMSPLPTDIRTPNLPRPEAPAPNGQWATAELECLLQFGAWSVMHAGTGDVRLGARIMGFMGAEEIDTGIVGVDWIRCVNQTGQFEKSRIVTIPNVAQTQPIDLTAQLMYSVSGAPTTKSVGYGWVRLIPLRWRLD